MNALVPDAGGSLSVDRSGGSFEHDEFVGPIPCPHCGALDCAVLPFRCGTTGRAVVEYQLIQSALIHDLLHQVVDVAPDDAVYIEGCPACRGEDPACVVCRPSYVAVPDTPAARVQRVAALPARDPERRLEQ